MDVLVVGGIFREVLDADAEPRPRYGGSGLTAAVAAARFGANVALASYVGAEDEEAVRAELELAGVNHRSLLAVPGASGTFAFPTRQDNQRPWPMYRPAEELPKITPKIPDANIVLAFGIPDCDPVELGWFGDDPTYGTMIWDRQGWLSRARDAESIQRINVGRRIYVANEFEAMEEAGVDSLCAALDSHPPAGFDASIVKRGSRGVVVIEQQADGATKFTVPAFPVPTNSTIGTGDVFAGVLAARLALGEPVDVAAKWGCSAASISLTLGRHLMSAESYWRARGLLFD